MTVLHLFHNNDLARHFGMKSTEIVERPGRTERVGKLIVGIHWSGSENLVVFINCVWYVVAIDPSNFGSCFNGQSRRRVREVFYSHLIRTGGRTSVS